MNKQAAARLARVDGRWRLSRHRQRAEQPALPRQRLRDSYSQGQGARRQAHPSAFPSCCSGSAGQVRWRAACPPLTRRWEPATCGHGAAARCIHTCSWRGQSIPTYRQVHARRNERHGPEGEKRVGLRKTRGSRDARSVRLAETLSPEHVSACGRVSTSWPFQQDRASMPTGRAIRRCCARTLRRPGALRPTW
jgi:hypothetical protein